RHQEEPGRAGAGRQPRPAIPGHFRSVGRGAASPVSVRAGGVTSAEEAGGQGATDAGGCVTGLLPRWPVPGSRHGP
ncbi:hypothetical protein N303_00301, partial [Cuculus canorus]